MRQILDSDFQKLRTAHMASIGTAHRLLGEVLSSIHENGREIPNPPPRIRELTADELTVFYPERA